jgi:DNA-binding NarL/FixJ family response regulator
MITIVVADDQDLIREGVAALLAAEPDISVLGTAADGAEAVGLIEATSPDVALMDIRMPNIDGIQATIQIVAAKATTRILILTTFDADDYVLAALAAGASGYLLKDAPRSALIASVRAVAAGEATLDSTVLKRLVTSHLHSSAPPTHSPALQTLSPRETEILKLVGEGATNSEIGHALFISETTVKTHITRTLTKLQARDRTHLVVIAHRAGLVG